MSRKTVTIKYGIQMKEPRKFPSWLKRLFIIAVIAAAIFLLYKLVIWILAPTQEDIQMMSATPTEIVTPAPTENITPTPTIRSTPTLNPNMSYELMSLAKDNEHVKALINIPGVGIDTAIAQWEDNEFFKDHDNYLNYDGYGSVYFDYRSDISYIFEAGNIVVYGYNQIGGRQLKKLTRYENEDYFINNSLVVVETIYGMYNFRVFSVHIKENDSDYTDVVSVKDMEKFINDCIEQSIFASNDLPEKVILTFSTDIDSVYGDRLLIHAFLENY